jgi:hypothetical protein
MASVADKLLDARFNHTNAQSRYLLIAGMTGNLVTGDREKAVALWNRSPGIADKTRDFTLRLLYAHAFGAGESNKQLK